VLSELPAPPPSPPFLSLRSLFPPRMGRCLDVVPCERVRVLLWFLNGARSRTSVNSFTTLFLASLLFWPQRRCQRLEDKSRKKRVVSLHFISNPPLSWWSSFFPRRRRLLLNHKSRQHSQVTQPTTQ